MSSEYVSPATRAQRRYWRLNHAESAKHYWEFRHDDVNCRAWVRREIAYAKFYRDYRFWYERLFNPILQFLMLK